MAEIESLVEPDDVGDDIGRGALITLVNLLDRNRWLPAVRCLYYISFESSVYLAYTFTQNLLGTAVKCF